MTFALCVVIVCGCTYIGVAISNRYKLREKYFNEVMFFCSRISGEIGFTKNLLKDCIINIAESLTTPLKDQCTKFCELLTKYKEINSQSLNQVVDNKILTDDERRAVALLFGCLGKGDSAAQLNEIEGYKAAIAGFQSRAVAESQRYAGLCSKLGFFCGVLIAVLFI